MGFGGVRDLSLVEMQRSSDSGAGTVLVTGGAGFVGAAVVRALIADGQRVRVLVRAHSDQRNLSGLPVECVLGDVRDLDAVRAAVVGCVAVFHVAAFYSSQPADEALLYAVNVDGTHNVLRAVADAGVTTLVHTSTIGTIGRPAEGTALPNEDTPFNLWDQASHYVRSKVLAEQAVLAADVPAVVVNPTAPVGPGDGRPTATGARLLAYLRGQMPPYLDGGINFCGVDDIARGHLLAAHHGRRGERYILGHPDGNLDLASFLAVMAQASGQPPPRHAASWRARLDPHRWRIAPAAPASTRPLALTCDPTKALRALQWQPGPLLDAFMAAVRWLRARFDVGT